MISKEEIDKLLERYKAQPVGNGYIDVIVRRENVRPLIESLVEREVKIYRITWWEYLDSVEKNPKFGQGGPRSRYYDGWYSEFCYGSDDIITNVAGEIIKVIENKLFEFGNRENISYDLEESLTPAIWLDVPDEWKSS